MHRRSAVARLRDLIADRGGNFAVTAGLVSLALSIGVGVSIDYSMANNQRQKMQEALDAGVLAAVHKTALADQRDAIEKVVAANIDVPDNNSLTALDFDAGLKVDQNKDGSVTANLTRTIDTNFMGLIGMKTLAISAKATAIAASTGTSGPCVYVLGSSGQDVLINSGANVSSAKCAMHVHSTANPAFIMNSGSTIKLASFCVKGTNYIKNGGTLDNLKVGCAVEADPYKSKIAEPALPSSCTTSGWYNDANVTINPGMHCDTGFNGSPTITFKPGLHIIKGRMIINSGATVIADGVTFYFPDTNSEIRANGALTFTGKAPSSGTYAGILMFEKTSDSSNNNNKTQYIFNGSKGETLEGVIYLPNRNVTYNSTTNVAAKITLVVNQVIMNSAKWLIEPYEGTGASGAATMARLVE